MKNNLLIYSALLFSFLWINNDGIAQTYYGDANLYTQQAVIDFASHGYTNITGRLYIGTSPFTSDNITDISQLSTVETVGGDLGVHGCYGLTSLNGLSGITTVGRDLLIKENEDLENLSGLGAIIDVTRDVQISENELLTNVDLVNLTTVGGLLFISKNESLLSLNGLASITSVRSIQVQYNDTLESIAPFATITGSIFDLKIDSNKTLTTLYGLHNITSVHYLKIKKNRGLINLNGLEGITNLNLVEIVNNSSLTTLDGLSSLDSVNDLYVKENNVLTDYCSLNIAVDNGIPEYFVSANGFNPTYQDMQLGSCSIEPFSVAEEYLGKRTTLTPNPTHGGIDLDFVNIEDRHLKISNELGQIVYQDRGINNLNHHIDLNVPTGIYIVEIYTGKMSEKLKLIVY